VNPVTGGTGSVMDGDAADGTRHAGALHFDKDTLYQVPIFSNYYLCIVTIAALH
jgi:hypothetical protein